MPQRRMILVVTIIALGAAGIWTWRERSQQQPASAEATPLSTQGQTPVEESRLSTSSYPDATGSASSILPPPSAVASTEPSSPAPDGAPSATNTQAEPVDVDTPEPAARKFASGGHEPASDPPGK